MEVEAEIVIMAADRVPLISPCGNRPARGVRLRRLCWRFRRSSTLLLMYIGGYLTYLSVGALVFSTLEQPLDRQLNLERRSRIDKFLSRYPTIPGARKSIQASSFYSIKKLKIRSIMIYLWRVDYLVGYLIEKC